MQWSLLFQGMLLGIAIAVPVGPVGILCLRRSLEFGRLAGLCSGLGAACADTFLGAVAAFGLSFIYDFLTGHHLLFQLFGGAFLLGFGIKTILYQNLSKNINVSHRTLIGDFLSTFILTLTSPMTLVAYVALLAGFGFCEPQAYFSSAVWLVLGVFIGSSLWWIVLSEGLCFLRDKLSLMTIYWTNRIMGIIVALCGLAIWANILIKT